MSLRKFLFLLVCFTQAFCYGQENTVKDKATGAVFSKEVYIQDNGKKYELDVTGVATRKKFFVKVYSVASYLQKGTINGNTIAAILSDDTAKQLTLKWARDVGRKRVIDGFHDSFQKVFNKQEQDQLQNEINQFLSFFRNNVKKGDIHNLRWLPGGNIEVLINNQKVGTLTNAKFAKGLWNVWFGANSVVNRSDLISMAK